MSAAPTQLQRPAPPCAECGAPVRGAFCASCGQKAEGLRQPVHHFVRDAFAEFFGIDGRVWRTFVALLVRPGTLTRAYHEGRRQRYLRPLRVYLTSTLLFFFLLSVLDPIGRSREAFLGDDAGADSLRVSTLVAQNDSALAIDPDALAAARIAEARAKADSALAALTVAAGTAPRGTGDDERLERIADARTETLERIAEAQESGMDRETKRDHQRTRVEQAILSTMSPDSVVYADDIRGAARMVYPDTARIFSTDGDWRAFKGSALRGVVGARTEKERADSLVEFLKAALGYVPTVLFLILPVFALLLKLLYVRRRWYYSEHVVFALHTHAFVFVVFAAATVLVRWKVSLGPASGAFVGWVVVALLASIPVYFLVAQKRVYGQSWRKTISKALVLGTVYNGVLIAGLAAAFAFAALIG